MAQSGSALLRLPSEILHDICSRFCEHCTSNTSGSTAWTADLGPYSADPEAPHDLVNLSLTCRLLREVAQPILYHTVNRGNMLLFLRTLAERPGLAEHVYGVSTHRLRQPETTLTPHDKRWVQEAAIRAGLELPAADWLHYVPRGRHGNDETGHPDPNPEDEGDEELDHHDGHVIQGFRLVDVMLALLPSLEALSVTQEYGWSVGALLARQKKLPSVKRLYVIHWDTEVGCDLGRNRMLFGVLPNLERLDVEMCSSIPPGLPLANVRSLRFDNSKLDAQSLENIVAACPRLERWSYGSTPCIAADSDEFGWGDAQRVLRSVAATLRYADLTGGDDYLEFNMTDTTEHFGSFADFVALETLIIDLAGFDHDTMSLRQAIDLLPASVRRLSIPHLQEDGAVVVAELAAEGRFPKLEVVSVLDSGKRLENLTAILARAGVICERYYV